jgi:ligand-binding sensor domain-containing protein
MTSKKIILLTFSIIFLISCEKAPVDESVVANLDQAAISSIAFDNSNTMWVGTDAGLFKSVSGGYKNIYFEASKKINTLRFEKTSNVLWIGTNSGLSKLTNVSNTSEIAEKILSSNLNCDTIKSIFVDSISAQWFGTSKGLNRFFTNNWQKSSFKKNASGTISAAAFEKIGVNSIASWDGDYYIATDGKYLYRCSGWDETVDAFTGATTCQAPWNGSSITDTMNVVFVDSKNRQWMAGNNGIQSHTDHNSKANITTYDVELVNLRVHAVAEAPNGDIWIGTENGISIFNGTNWTTSNAVLPNKFVTAIAFESTGKAWIGTKKGLISIKL